ncbi:uncharacterized protein BDV14DRAFT_180592 [Aspergillus stella-maris]|uniref:uncharacterized protein n=1 Tax=Aspergillus stella-maris TaxID=1810926 RepID=UPI003CCDBC27
MERYCFDEFCDFPFIITPPETIQRGVAALTLLVKSIVSSNLLITPLNLCPIAIPVLNFKGRRYRRAIYSNRRYGKRWMPWGGRFGLLAS